MKAFQKKVSDSERAGWTHDLFKISAQKIPCEGNCPYMVVTDTLNCRKELEGLVDMEEVRGTDNVRFGRREKLNNDPPSPDRFTHSILAKEGEGIT